MTTTGPPLEAELERYLSRQVKAAGGRTFKLKFVAMRGAPDRLVLLPGFGAFVELKRTSGSRLEPLQNHVRGMLLHAGLRTYALGSRNQIDTFMELARAQNPQAVTPIPKTRRRIPAKE